MFKQNNPLMPALLTAALLALAGTATAQEHGVIEDMKDAMTDPEPFVPVEQFSATDSYSTLVVDTCVEHDGAQSFDTTAVELPNLHGEGTWVVAEEGETVSMGGFSTADAPTPVYRTDLLAFVDPADPCCVCGTQGTNPMGCQAFGDVCCCSAEISMSLDEITCWCQGGKGCDFDDDD